MLVIVADETRVDSIVDVEGEHGIAQCCFIVFSGPNGQVVPANVHVS